MFTRSTATAAICLMMPLAAQAGNMAEPVARPTTIPMTNTAMDWTGSYAGLGFGSHGGTIAFTPGSRYDITSGTAISVFGGYQIQRGNLVYGGELAINSITDAGAGVFIGNSEVTEMNDLKGRLGYASGSFLVYGVLGYSTGIYNDSIAAPGNEWDISGMNYGLGIDYAVSDNWVMGAEYLIRDTSGEDPFGFSQVVDVEYETLSLRVSYQF